MEHHILVKKYRFGRTGGRDRAGRDGQAFQRVSCTCGRGYAYSGVEPNHARGLDGEVVSHLWGVGVPVQKTRWQVGAARVANDDGAVIAPTHQ